MQQITEENTAKLDWQKIVEDYEKSGLKQAEYCRQHHLNPVRLSYHRIRLARQQQVSSPKAYFNPVKVTPSNMNDFIKVALPNGFQCEFSSDTDVMQVKKLIEILLSC